MRCGATHHPETTDLSSAIVPTVSIAVAMARNTDAATGRNVARRQKAVFEKCQELSRFGLDIWVVICSGDGRRVFKSSERGFFRDLDRQVAGFKRL